MSKQLVLLSPEKMQPWGSPKILPPGAYDYILLGNPAAPELYTFRFQLPAHYKIPPFKLTKQCCMTVISGSLYIEEGNSLGKSQPHLMPEKSFIIIPADTQLSFANDKETVLQFHGVGPIDFIYSS